MSEDSLGNLEDRSSDDEGGRRQDELIERRFAEEEEIRPLIGEIEAALEEDLQGFDNTFPNIDDEIAEKIDQAMKSREARWN